MSILRLKLFIRIATVGLALGLALAATGCGSSASSGTPPVTSAKTQIKIGDAPADSVLSFELTITRIDLTQQGGTMINVMSTPAEIELAHLAGTVEPLALASVPSGTYSSASITVSKAEVSYIPTGSTTPVEKQFALNFAISVPFNPPISLGNNPSVLSFDLDLAQSLTFDASGNVTAINPVFSASTAAVAPQGEQDEESGEVEDLVGVISAITPASGNSAASFSLTPQSGGPDQSFTVDADTEFGDGLTQFGDLKVGMLVEVDAVTQSDGSLLAKEVQMTEASDGLEADGIITSTSGNPITSLSLLVQDDAGNMSSNTVGTTLNVDVSTAVFENPQNEPDLSSLLQGLPFTPKFDNTSAAVGQRIEVDGVSAGQVQGSFIANDVKLRSQALTGTVGPPANGSNASFSLLLDADSAFVKLTGQAAINVYQVSATELKGLTSVAQGSRVRVRGLLLFDGTNYQFVAARISLP